MVLGATTGVRLRLEAARSFVEIFDEARRMTARSRIRRLPPHPVSAAFTPLSAQDRRVMSATTEGICSCNPL